MSNDVLKQPKLHLKQIKKIENISDKIYAVIKYLDYQLEFLQAIYNNLESNVEFQKGVTEFQKEVIKKLQ
jgi:hypothetical protein